MPRVDQRNRSRRVVPLTTAGPAAGPSRVTRRPQPPRPEPGHLSTTLQHCRPTSPTSPGHRSPEPPPDRTRAPRHHAPALPPHFTRFTRAPPARVAAAPQTRAAAGPSHGPTEPGHLGTTLKHCRPTSPGPSRRPTELGHLSTTLQRYCPTSPTSPGRCESESPLARVAAGASHRRAHPPLGLVTAGPSAAGAGRRGTGRGGCEACLQSLASGTG